MPRQELFHTSSTYVSCDLMCLHAKQIKTVMTLDQMLSYIMLHPQPGYVSAYWATMTTAFLFRLSHPTSCLSPRCCCQLWHSPGVRLRTLRKIFKIKEIPRRFDYSQNKELMDWLMVLVKKTYIYIYIYKWFVNVHHRFSMFFSGSTCRFVFVACNYNVCAFGFW